MRTAPDTKGPGRSPTGEAGAQAETLAARYLEARGMKLVERNWRSRFGEIDLVFREGPVIVFVEVRLRTNARYGSAGESIDYRKCTRLLAAARQYLAGQPRAACRFDAILLRRLDPPEIEWIRDAISE